MAAKVGIVGCGRIAAVIYREGLLPFKTLLGGNRELWSVNCVSRNTLVILSYDEGIRHLAEFRKID